MDPFPLCPNCLTTSAVYRKVTPYGPCEEHFDRWGQHIEFCTDQLWFSYHPQVFGKPKRIYCLNCGKQRKDLHVVDGKVVEITRG